MIWLAELALLAIAVALLANFAGGRTRSQRIEDLRQGRVAAYAETIRRTHTPGALDAMSDVELADVLISASRRLQADRARRGALLVAAGFGVAIAAIYFGTVHGPSGFAVAGAIGAITVFGIDRIYDRHTDTWTGAMHLDRDRLAID